MASPRTPVSSFLGTACLASLRAEIVELRKMVADLSSKVERLEASSSRVESKGSIPKARCAKLAARGSPSAEAGRAIEGAPKVSSRAGMSTAKKSDEWKVVSIRGDRGVVLRRQGVAEASADALPVSNRFSVLSEDIAPAAIPVTPEVAEPEGGRGVLVIGSSNVRRIMDPLRARARREGVCERVFSRCLPGGTVPKVTEELRTSVSSSDCSVLRVVVHAGTNDASRFGSEEILGSFKDLIAEASRVESESGVRVSLSFCSIVPRSDRGSEVWSRVVGLNQRLRDFCRSNGVEFVDLRPVLDSCRLPLNRSGVHYTARAAELVARRIFEVNRVFLG